VLASDAEQWLVGFGCSEGGFFNARLTFPKDYPNSPPTCRFTSEMWHPNGENVHGTSHSLLHPAGIAECSRSLIAIWQFALL
jgi:hypothetical protein